MTHASDKISLDDKKKPFNKSDPKFDVDTSFDTLAFSDFTGLGHEVEVRFQKAISEYWEGNCSEFNKTLQALKDDARKIVARKLCLTSACSTDEYKYVEVLGIKVEIDTVNTAIENHVQTTGYEQSTENPYCDFSSLFPST